MTKFRQLIEDFSPFHYSLHIDLTETSQRKFSGEVEINGRLLRGSQIVLHAKDLVINEIMVDRLVCQFTHGEHDELIISQGNLELGEHTIQIKFSGEITDAMHGLYPCYYKHQGQVKQIFATQFESHHAREVFPCIDEPSAKATFNVSLTTDQNLVVLGNMPVTSQEKLDNLLLTKFETTPTMSTYLVAFVVGELHKKTAYTKRGVETNIWAGPHQNSRTLDFALDIATRTIDFFEDYFGIEYPLAKADHVALPDFSSGAMENWGLITYRESALLYDPSQTTENAKRLTATVIAHELSHQWFGNLVTMKWWNDLWLNESFANMMEYVAVDALEPSWHIWEDFATGEVISALRRDSNSGVQPVKVDVRHPDEISALFDPSIVYAKGGRLLKMVRQLVGEKSFRKGLKNYFTKFAYQNAEGDNLWQAIEQASAQPIQKIMNQWISQPGLPVVRVTTEKNSTTLSQHRFFVGKHPDDESLWPIPLFANQSSFDKIFDVQQKTFGSQGDVILNKGLGAHFVTSYDDRARKNLLALAINGQLDTLDKLCFLQDSSLLVMAGELPSASLLPLALSFKNEANEKVYDLAILALNDLRKFVEKHSEEKTKLKQITREFAQPTFRELGWDATPGEGDDRREKRSSALALMSYSEDESTLIEAKRRFDLGIDSISPEIRSIILSTTVRHFETPELVSYLLELYSQTPSVDLQIDISLGLTSTRQAETVKCLLENIKNTTIVRPQDASYWYIYLLRNPFARTTTWQWLRNNWSWVKQTFGGDKSYDNFVRYSGSSLMTRKELEEFTAFFTPMLNEPSLERVIKLAINEINARVEQIEHDKQAVLEAISSYQSQ